MAIESKFSTTKSWKDMYQYEAKTTYGEDCDDTKVACLMVGLRENMKRTRLYLDLTHDLYYLSRS